MKYPSVHFEIYEGLMTNVVNQLINGNAELGIANIQMVDTDKFDMLSHPRRAICYLPS